MTFDRSESSGINFRRVAVGGFFAGLLYNAGGIAIAALLDLPAAFSRMGFQPTLVSGLMHLAMRFGYGFLSLFLYAAIRPRFGAGLRTAIITALVVWLTAYVPLSILMAELTVFTTGQAFAGAAWGVLEASLATAVGAYLYRE